MKQLSREFNGVFYCSVYDRIMHFQIMYFNVREQIERCFRSESLFEGRWRIRKITDETIKRDFAY